MVFGTTIDGFLTMLNWLLLQFGSSHVITVMYRGRGVGI